MIRSMFTTTVAITLTSAVAAQAATIAQWTFETNLSPVVNGTTGIGSTTLPPVTPEVNNDAAVGATLTSTHAKSNAANKVFYTGSGNGSATGFYAASWSVGDYDQVSANLSGYTGVQMSVDVSGSSTGPGTFNVQYSTDGTNFTDLPGSSFTLPSTTPSFSTTTNNPALTHTFDLSSLGSTIRGLRIVDTSDTSINGGSVSTSSGAGTNRLDNLTIIGTPVTTPEPASLGLLCIAGVTVLRRRRI